MKTKLKWQYLLFITVSLALMMFHLSISAQETGSIKFSYVAEGVEFRLYKVGNITSSGEFVLTDSFSPYSVDLTDTNVPQTLTAYAKRDNISPDGKAYTNSEHNAVFNGLDVGIYLIEGDSCSIGKKTYTPSPIMVALKERGTNITAKGKYETKTSPGGGSHGGGDTYQEVSVLKVWEGDSGKSPVTVQLLRNGKVYVEITLSEKNNWKYTWTGLSSSDTWSVVEKTVIDNYNVSIEKDGTVYIIKNTYTPSETPTETTTIESAVESTTTNTITPPPNENTPGEENPPGGHNPPGSDEDTEVGTEGGGSEDDKELGELSASQDDNRNVNNPKRPKNPSKNPNPKNSVTGGKLPQTGQLWWPVPVFAFAGVLFVIIGMACRKEDSRYECE